MICGKLVHFPIFETLRNLEIDININLIKPSRHLHTQS